MFAHSSRKRVEWIEPGHSGGSIPQKYRPVNGDLSYFFRDFALLWFTIEEYQGYPKNTFRLGTSGLKFET